VLDGLQALAVRLGDDDAVAGGAAVGGIGGWRREEE